MPDSADSALQRLSRVCGGWDPQQAWDGAGIPQRAVSAWSRPAARAVAVLLSIGLCLAAYWAFAGRPRESVTVGAAPAAPASMPVAASPDAVASLPAVPSPSEAPPATVPPAEIVVHVVGAVRRPGIVHLPPGSRVVDAVAAAGGVIRPRAAASVNMARPLQDGEQIVVGVGAVGAVGVPAGSSTPAAPGAPGASGAPGSAGAAPLDLNSADAAALEGLPGIGPVIAQRIVDWRSANGRFRSIDELGEVSGIGDSILAQLRGHVVL